VVPLGNEGLVYARKELLATGETTADVLLGDIMPARSNSGGDAGDREIGGGNLNEVQNRVITKGCPAANPCDERARSERRFYREIVARQFGFS